MIGIGKENLKQIFEISSMNKIMVTLNQPGKNVKSLFYL